MSVYTQQNLVKVFAELCNSVGKYNSGTWLGTMPQLPSNIEDCNKEEIYQTILALTDKYFQKRKPKSWRSLAMQVGICLSIQSLEDLEQATVETRGRNRMAAYTAGFLTMSDILHLEKMENGYE